MANRDLKKELMEAASKVRGAYDGFAIGVWVNARSDDTVEETIELIRK